MMCPLSFLKEFFSAQMAAETLLRSRSRIPSVLEVPFIPMIAEYAEGVRCVVHWSSSSNQPSPVNQTTLTPTRLEWRSTKDIR